MRHLLVIREIVTESHNFIPRNYFKINFLKSCTMTELAYEHVKERQGVEIELLLILQCRIMCDSVVGWGHFCFLPFFILTSVMAFSSSFGRVSNGYFLFLELDLKQLINCFKELIYKLGQTPFKERSWLHGIFRWSNIQIPVDILNFFINEMSRPDSVSSIR